MTSKPTYYAIGDVHGMADMIHPLIATIKQSIIDNNVENPHIVFLGDYVDRGPDSKGVIDQIWELEKEFKVTALMGNHEDQLVWCYDNIDNRVTRLNAIEWMKNYGNLAIQSWGIQSVLDLPIEYVQWMRNLPCEWMDGDNKICFVHAGITPKIFPDLHKQTALWTRSLDFENDRTWAQYKELDGWLIVHGHTPVNLPYVSKRRINLDTGACFNGALTCAKIDTSKDNSVTLFDYDYSLQKIRQKYR